MMKKIVFPLLTSMVLGLSVQQAYPYISVIIEEFEQFFYQENEDGSQSAGSSSFRYKYTTEYDDRTGEVVSTKTDRFEEHKKWSTENVGKFYEDHRAQIEDGSITIKSSRETRGASINIGNGEIIGRLYGDQIVRVSSTTSRRIEMKSYEIVVHNLGKLPPSATGEDTPTSKNKPLTSQALNFFNLQNDMGIPSGINNSVVLSAGVDLCINRDLGT